MNRDVAEQVERTIARERAQWSALIAVDDGTPAFWEDLVRRTAPHVTQFPYWPRWEATSAFTPSAVPELYKLPTDLAAEWQKYRVRWERFLDANPRARIADMLSDCSESNDASSFPSGWEHVIQKWAMDGFPTPAPFYADARIRSDAWKSKLTDAMRRAGDGWVYQDDDVNYEWRS